MVKRITIIAVVTALLFGNLSAQKNTRSFIFGHSLINHALPINPTPSQETSVPHWMHFLAEAAGHTYAVSGQYGFLPQHANLPPIAQWGFDFADGAWASDYDPFSAADFTNILITPGNFIQWQGPTENYPSESISPVGATETIINWCAAQEADLKFYIYENWPDMAPYLTNAFPPTTSDWDNYNNYLTNNFHDWFLAYHDYLVENIPDACIKMIPVGPIISALLNQSPYDQIPVDQLYEDDAPHGRANIYFLASLITYMATYEEKAPLDYQVVSIIHPIIAENYQAIVNTIWDNLLDFNFLAGESRVFCDAPIINATEHLDLENEVRLRPNPVKDYLHIENEIAAHNIEIYGIDGQIYSSNSMVNSNESMINVDFLPAGFYILIGKDATNDMLYMKKFIKQ